MKLKVCICAIILLYVPTAVSAQREVDFLRAENIELRKTVDSLKAELRNARMSSLSGELFNPWDNLITEQEYIHSLSVTDTRAERKVVEDKLSKIDFRLRVPYNDIIQKYIDFYCIDKAKNMESIAARYRQWNPYFEEVFAKYGVPAELTALCIVESAVNPKARSRAGAVGMWQLMSETATDAGLTVTFFTDERLDVYRSTPVAAAYLANAFKTFGDWRLAVLSYNAGIRRVQEAVEKAGSTDVWDIYPFLPKETQGYLPSLIGALYYLKQNA